MTTQTNHVLTIPHTADLDAAIGALDEYGIRVVCVDANPQTAFERVVQLTVRPSVEIDLPLIEYVVRGVGIELLDLGSAGCGTLVGCGH